MTIRQDAREILRAQNRSPTMPTAQQKHAASSSCPEPDAAQEILEEYDERRLERMAKAAARKADGKLITWRIIACSATETVMIHSEDDGRRDELADITTVYLRAVYRLRGTGSSAGIHHQDVRIA